MTLGCGSSGALSTLSTCSLGALALSTFATLGTSGRSLSALTLGCGSSGGLATLNFATLDHDFGGASNCLALAGATVLEEEVGGLGTGCEGSHQNYVKHE